MKNHYLLNFNIKPVFGLLLSILFFSTCKEDYIAQADPNANTAVKLQAVKTQNLALTDNPFPIEAIGFVEPKAEINLAFRIGGTVNQLFVDESQRVKEGQLLATITSKELEQQVLKAKQNLDKAQRDIERIQKMYKDSIATIEQVEDLTTRLEVAKSDLKIAEVNQEYTSIYAPLNGRVLKRFIEVNELASPGRPIFKLSSSEGTGYSLKINITDKDIVRIKSGDKAQIFFDAYPDQAFNAVVSQIAQAADPRTGTFEVELAIASERGFPLKNGFIAKAKLFPTSRNSYYKITMNALVEGYRDHVNIFASIPKGKSFFAKKIKIVPEYIGSDFFTVSTDQLEGIDQVVVDGSAYLEEGMEIRIIP